MRLVSLILLTLGIWTLANGQIVSTMDGPWSIGSTWVGGMAPASTDDVIINHDVVYTIGTMDYAHSGSVIINAVGRLEIIHEGVNNSFYTFDWTGTGEEFNVFGELDTEGRLFNNGGFMQFHTGSTIFIGNDLRGLGTSETIIDVPIDCGDDIYLVGANATICGSSTTSGTFDGSADCLDILSADSELQLLSGATLANICQGFTIDVYPGPTTFTGTGAFGPLFENNDVTLGISGTPFDENGGVATVTASIPGTSANDVTVNLDFSGTAGNGTDYSPSASAIFIPSGSMSGNITLTGTDDPADDDNETVIVDISTVINALETTPQQETATITDDDPKVTLGISGIPLVEDGGIATVTATLSTTADEDITVDLAFSGTATNTFDYTRSATQILIMAGDLTGDITITGVDDSDDDDDETVVVDISSVTNGTEDGTQQVTATITDDDDAPLVTLGLSDSPLAEAGGVATVTATLATLSNNDITVNLGFSGTADNPADYTRSAIAITITAGNNAGSITLTGVDDGVDEEDESIIVDITSVGNGTEDGDQQVEATITDDDDPPTVTLSASPLSIPETAGASAITATLSAISEKDVTITLGYTGTAAFTTDYSADLSIMISAGAMSGSFDLDALTDPTDEDDETAIIDITATTNATETGTEQVTVTIVDDDDPPTVILSASPLSIPETAGASTITATLSAISEKDVTITLGYTGTAAITTDYSADLSIMISAGALSGSFDLDALTDPTDEDDETAIIDITATTNATETGTEQVTVTIVDDDDPPTVTLSASPLSIPETAGASAITATLSAISEKDVTITLGYTGTAAITTDYSADPSIMISAGAMSGFFDLDALTDPNDEDDETAIIDITATTNATETGTEQVTVTIVDDDDPPTVILSASPLSIPETAGASTITATLSAISEKDVTITLGYTGTAAITTDYSADLSIMISAGAMSGFFDLDALTDPNDEDDETAIIDITATTNATETGTEQVTVTITDDDDPPTVTLSATQASIPETGGSSTITATLSAISEKDVTITLGYTGTAAITTDYSADLSIMISSGAMSGFFDLDALTDPNDEDDETAIIDITATTNATETGTEQVTVTIVDDDDPPTVTLGLSGSPFAENGGTATITATLSQLSEITVTINVVYSGSATNLTDYTRSADQIVIAPGNLDGTIILTGVDDGDDDDNETVIVDIATVTNGTENGTQQVTGIIADDDGIPAISLILTGSPLAENGGIATITATATNTVAATITINLAFTGTATNSTDYTRSGDQIVITAGNLNGSITISGVDDQMKELDETVIVDVTSVTNATESGMQQVTATISDDESPPTVTLSFAGSPLVEDGGLGTITANLSSTTFQDVTVDLQFTGTAEAEDYTVPAQSIVIPGGTANGSISLTAVKDQVDEEDETIIISIVSVSNGLEDGEQQETVIITDGNDPPILEASSLASGSSLSVPEGDVGSVLREITLSLSVPSEKAISFLYATNSVTASSPEDYSEVIPTLITFEPGVVEQVISFEIKGDKLAEDDESFQITLTDPENTTVPDPVIIVTIVDDDSSPMLADDQYETIEDVELVIAAPGVLDNDSDMDMDQLSLTVSVDPGNGDLILNPDGSFNYTPNPNFNGLDHFQYQASDGSNIESATVDITVTPANDPPTITGIDDQIVDTGETLGPLNFQIGDPETNPEQLSLDYSVADPSLFQPSESPFDVTGQDASFTIIAGEEPGATEITLTVSDGELLASITFHVSVVLDNSLPTDILLSNNTILEQQPPGTIVGEFSTVDPDVEDQHTYTLVEGDGDDNNGLFSIEDNELLSEEIFQFEQQSVFSIRVKSSDGDDSLEKAFLILVEEKPLSKELYLPNLFTPNGDGNNDLFILRGEGIDEIDFRIFNKFGELVFDTDDAAMATSAGWDGTSSGRDQPSGSYVWQLKGTYKDGTPLLVEGRAQGNITLLR